MTSTDSVIRNRRRHHRALLLLGDMGAGKMVAQLADAVQSRRRGVADIAVGVHQHTSVGERLSGRWGGGARAIPEGELGSSTDRVRQSKGTRTREQKNTKREQKNTKREQKNTKRCRVTQCGQRSSASA
eukprot:SAG11_NODE_1139_length_5714_cov_20.900267_2_plen_129_part_00